MSGKTYYIANPEPTDLYDMAEMIREKTGVSTIWSMPFPVAKFLAKTADLLQTAGWRSVALTSFRLRYVNQLKTGKIVHLWKSRSFILGLLKTGRVSSHPTFYVRRSVYEKHGYFDLNYTIAANYEFLLRMFDVKRINAVYIPNVLVHIRLGGESNKSFRNIVSHNRKIWQVFKMHNMNTAFWHFFALKTRQRLSQYLKKQ